MSISSVLINSMYEYKYSTPKLTDKEYDELLLNLPEYHPLRNITWDMVDSIYPEFNIYKTTSSTNSNLDIINQYGWSKSIQTVNDRNADILNDYLNNLINYCYKNQMDFDVVLSLKMDGWNIRNYYTQDGLILSHTRMTGTDNLMDTTDLLKTITPQIHTTMDSVAVNGELVVKRTSLDYLRNKYHKRFANPRNSVSTFVSGNINPEDYNISNYFAFALRDIYGMVFDNIIDTHCYLRGKGFNTPPYIRGYVPYSNDYSFYYYSCINKFEEIFNKIEQYYNDKFSAVYECDGVVLQPNYFSVADTFNTTSTIKTAGMLALKICTWGIKIYRSKVRKITFTKSKRNRALMLEIEPIDTGFGVIRRVDIDNLARAIKNEIDIGCEIEFTVHSNQDIQFLRKG